MGDRYEVHGADVIRTGPVRSSRPLTTRQQQALDFVKAFIAEWQMPPTLREIGDHMGIRSTNGVMDHLRSLERKGYIARLDMKSRAIRVLKP